MNILKATNSAVTYGTSKRPKKSNFFFNRDVLWLFLTIHVTKYCCDNTILKKSQNKNLIKYYTVYK